MALLRPELLVAFDASSVAGALLGRGWGEPRLLHYARISLSPGALVPAPFETNVVRPEEVREALESVRKALGTDGRRAVLVLPDGLARMMLLEVRDSEFSRDYVRFRLAQGLPYPVGEGVVDALRLARGRYLAAALRRNVVQGYEEVAAAAGFAQDRVDLAPLAALQGLLRKPVGPARTVDVILGDAAVSMAAFYGGVLRIFRNRRRDPDIGEPERLWEEVDRTAALAGDGTTPRVRIVGPGAETLRRRFAALGVVAEPGWSLRHDGIAVDASELAWLGGGIG